MTSIAGSGVRLPFWLPTAILLLLAVGSVVNNLQLSGGWFDLLLIIVFLIFCVIFSMRFGVVKAPKARQDAVLFFYLLYFLSIILFIFYYYQAGIPLLSDDPNVARMEFMQSTWVYKYLKVFLPFLMVYYSASTLMARGFPKILAGIGVLILFLFQLLSGGKGAAIWGVVFIFMGFFAAGGQFKLFQFLKFSIPISILTVLLFKHIEGLDSYWDAAVFILSRLTGVAEYGLYIVVNVLGGGD